MTTNNAMRLLLPLPQPVMGQPPRPPPRPPFLFLLLSNSPGGIRSPVSSRRDDVVDGTFATVGYH